MSAEQGLPAKVADRATIPACKDLPHDWSLQVTLILTALDWSAVVQVADRLVSVGGRPSDPMRNKNVVWHSRDGVLTFGYTGHAKLGGRWTDRWIAEVLRGESLGPVDGRMALKFGPAPARRDVGQGLMALREAAIAAFSRLRPKLQVAHDFVAAGWQWSREGRGRPVRYRIHNGQGGSAFMIEKLDRYWGWERGKGWLEAAPSGLFDELPGELAKRTGECYTPEERENLLADAIRHVTAGRSGTIGSDCMAITIHPPGAALVSVTFKPESPFQAQFVMQGRSVRVAAALSPWIVSEGMAAPPAVMAGSFQINDRGLIIEMNAPDPGASFHGFSGLQE